MASPTPDTNPHPPAGINSSPTFTNVPTAELAAIALAAPVAANADTTGATLAALETEVNQVKQALRDLGLMSP